VPKGRTAEGYPPVPGGAISSLTIPGCVRQSSAPLRYPAPQKTRRKRSILKHLRLNPNLRLNQRQSLVIFAKSAALFQQPSERLNR